MTFDGMELIYDNNKVPVTYKKRKIPLLKRIIEEIKLEIWVRKFIKQEYGNPYKYPELYE